MSSGPMELTLIPHALSGQDCSMAVCPEDTVTNFFFNDVIPNEDPCYLAELIKGSADEGITSTESDEESGDTTMEVGMSGLLDAVLNGGVECSTQLRRVFANFACGLSSKFDLSEVDTVHVRMMENLTPEEVTDIGSLASCECSGNPRFIINLVVPSFCSSSCVRDLTCRVAFSAEEMDVILYRYQLHMLKQKVNAHKCGLDQAAKTVAHMARQPSSGSYESFLSAQVDYLDSCLPEVASHIPSGPNYAAPSSYHCPATVPPEPVGEDDCVQSPSNAACANYTMPSAMVQEGIQHLCNEMPTMPGCTVRRLCTDEAENVSASPYCSEFSILKDLCVDMPSMAGCANYSSMCSNDSVVQQCQSQALPLPSTMATSDLIEQMCGEMTMADCDRCQKQGSLLQCDLLLVYSDLCLSVPEMDSCDAWKLMCTALPDWSLCPSPANSGAAAHRADMYYHSLFLAQLFP